MYFFTIPKTRFSLGQSNYLQFKGIFQAFNFAQFLQHIITRHIKLFTSHANKHVGYGAFLK
jgi:hypothetical protein